MISSKILDILFKTYSFSKIKNIVVSSSQFTKTDYLSAAMARENDMKHLRNNPNCIVFSIYCAGVAIECMLRAYISRHSSEYSSRHDLIKLLIESNLASLLTIREREQITVDIKEAVKIWNNNLRYTSELRIKRILMHEIAQQQYQPKNINKYLLKFKSEIFNITENFLKLAKSKWT